MWGVVDDEGAGRADQSPHKAPDSVPGADESWFRTWRATVQLTISRSAAGLQDLDQFEEIARAVLARKRVPRATYRLQFGPAFTFEDARRLVPYLDLLGISDVYASPLLKPGAGSTHGYDICDHNQLNPILGSSEAFDAFSFALRRRDLGLVFDVVPNHMGISDPDNGWWADVLEDGPISPFAPYFDIDWHPLKVEADLDNKVLLPILGDQYGKVLVDGELQLSYNNGSFRVAYGGRPFPVNPRSYDEVLSRRLAYLADLRGEDDSDVLELRSIITAIQHLPLETETGPGKVAERQREKTVIKRRIAQLVDTVPAIRDAIDDTVREYNGLPGQVQSFDLLDRLLNRQNYRLAFWRVAAEEINYRRFFDINDLAAIRMEQPEVFAETHRLITRLIAEEKVTGLRIDHADGLWDPAGYIRDLQRAAFLAKAGEWLSERFGVEGEGRESAESGLARAYDRETVRSPDSPIGRPIYVVVEKILGSRETLPREWRVDGTTGYDFANQVSGLFVASVNQKALTDLYASFIQRPMNYSDLVNSTKKMIMLSSLPSEVNELAFHLKRMARQSRWYRDLTLNSLTFALREVIASLPIYRTYVTEQGPTIDEHDRAAIEAAVADARRRNPRTAAAVFDFLRAVLLQQVPDDATEETRADWIDFVMRFQQITSPVVAKGVEDTAFYIYNRLISLNEVGGNPEAFGLSPANFHRLNLQRQARWPHSMLAASTHDSKRSADVRARLNVLSEIPGLLRPALTRWSRQNRSNKTRVQGAPAPDRNDEYFLYQTLLGVWPLDAPNPNEWDAFRVRVQDYLQKAIREAKVHTSWVNPNADYDEATRKFVAAILIGPKSAAFRASFEPIQRLVAFYGMLNSLSQTLIQLTAPGVPDTYQGDELWNFSLVDPDNRRPVDYALRARLLSQLRERIAGPAPIAASLLSLATDLRENWTDGRIKLYLFQRVLDARRRHPEVFGEGSYRPIELAGPAREHAVGFARQHGPRVYLTLVPRLVSTLTRQEPTWPLGAATWGHTTAELPDDLARASWRNLFTGEILQPAPEPGTSALLLSDAFHSFPVALLVGGEPGSSDGPGEGQARPTTENTV